MTKEILKQTLEALESDNPYIRQLAASAVRKALEQPEQEPTPWRDMVVVTLVREGINKHRARELADHFATPPAAQRPWVGLTASTILNLMPSSIPADHDGALMDFARTVEAKLKKSNGY